MNMKELYSKKGIALENFYSAQEDEPRCGVIRKEMKIWSPSDWGTCNATYSLVGVEINTFSDTIAVHFLKGSMPYAENLFYALLADRDVRRLIKKYQKIGRKQQYKIWHTSGVTGRMDVFMTFGRQLGGFMLSDTIKLVHISQFGRLNEGFGNESSEMYIGDFVELVAYLDLTEDMRVPVLRKKAKVKYIRPRLAEEIGEDFRMEVTKLL